MITQDPYGIGYVIKPGCMPEPLQPVHTCDPPEIIAICLSCPVEAGCYPELSVCPLNGRNRRQDERARKDAKHNARTVKILERDEKLLYMLTHGWKNTECSARNLALDQRLYRQQRSGLESEGKYHEQR